MVSLTTALIAIVAAVVLYVLFKKDGKKRNFPPGPIGWPILGNVLSLRPAMHLKICEWAEEYGNIFQFKMGSERLVVISDPKLIREAFNDPKLSGRPDLESFNLISGGPRGVVNSMGDEWTEQRRFTLRHLRDFGFGKNYFESTIMEEVNELLATFKREEGHPINVSRKFSLAVLNSLWVILTSRRYKQDDPRLVEIFMENNRVTEEIGSSPAIFMPKLAKLAPDWTGWNKLLRLADDMKRFVRESVEEHKATFPNDGHHRDFTDAYLHEMKVTKDPNSSFYGALGEKNLLAVIGDLFGAGAETTSSTLTWAILLLSKFPETQKKVQEELDRVVGKNRQPSLNDRPVLNYCMAAMEEVLRFNSLIPLSVFHTAMVDVKFHGFDIPKGTWVAGNLYGVHFDPKIFENPKDFKPTRFLSDDGQSFKKSDNVIPFSVGKRQCLGESLARDEYFLMFTSIFQKFDIQLAEKSKNVSLEAKPGFALMANSYEVVMRDRLTN